MRRPRLATSIIALLLAGGGSVAHGFSFEAYETQETQPATAAATAPAREPLTATVTEIEGLVQVRLAEDQPWQRPTKGMRVGENAEFRTGARSAVQFTIPPDQTITLDRLGTVKVLQAALENGVVRTNLGMRYGRTRYDIEAAGREHEATITSPSATLAVRGTRFSAFDQRPFAAEGVSLTGRVEFRDRKKRTAFGGRGTGKSRINVNNPNAASVALNEAVVDPGIRFARTEAEERLVNTLLSSGATVSFDYEKGIRVVRGGQPPRTDAELVPTLPGALNFVLRWQGNTDLNLGVFARSDVNPSGESLYPIGTLDRTASGARIPFDHRGGPNGGIEVGFWPDNFPSGGYSFGSVHISGPNAPATIEVFQNGQRVQFNDGGGNPTTVANYTAGPLPPEFGAGQFVGSVILTGPQPANAKKAAVAAAPKRVKLPAVPSKPAAPAARQR